MTNSPIHVLLQHLRSRVANGSIGQSTDQHLLQRFAIEKDEAAFDALVQRHGPMVWNLCRRMLGSSAYAEDAFQATFLVLVQKARSIRKQRSVGSWLYGVAYRIATRARGDAARNRVPLTVDLVVASVEGIDEALQRELQEMLDEELCQLPDKLRAPLLLCYLEEKTQEETAQQLGWSKSTVRRRLQRALELLHARLTRRGVGLSAGTLTVLSGSNAIGVGLPTNLVASTVRTGLLVVAGTTTGIGISERVVAWTEGVVRAMSLTKLKLSTVVVLVLGLVAASAGVLAHQKVEPSPESRTPMAEAPPMGKNSPDRHSSATDGHKGPIPPEAVVLLGSPHLRHRIGPVYAMDYSPDGSRLATAGGSTIKVWQAKTGKELLKLQGHQGAIYALAFSPDGRTLVSAGENKVLHLWDAKTGKRLRLLQGHRGVVWSVAFSPDGKHLVSGGTDKTVRVWNTSTGKLAQVLQGHLDTIRSVTFSPNGKHIVSAGKDRQIVLWDIVTGKRKRLWQEKGEVLHVAFSPTGETLAALGSQLSLWDPSTGKRLHSSPEFGWSCCFSPDGTMLAVPRIDGSVMLWDTRQGRPLRRIAESKDNIYSLAFAPDGTTLAVGGLQPVVRLWGVATGKEKNVGVGHQSGIVSLAYSPDGKLLVSAAGRGDSTVRLWDVKSRKLLRTLSALGVSKVAFSPDGNLLVFNTSKAIQIVDVATGKVRFRMPIDSVRSLSISPSGSLLAAGTSRGIIVLRDIQSGKALRKLHGPTGSEEFNDITFSPDGQLLASAETNGQKGGSTVRVWDVVTGKEVHRFGVSNGESLAFDPTGKELVFQATNGMLSFWNRSTGQVRHIEVEEQRILTLAYSPDGRTLALGNTDGLTVRAVVNGKLLLERFGQTGCVFALAFSPDGQSLASGNANGTIRIWDAMKKQRRRPQ